MKSVERSLELTNGAGVLQCDCLPRLQPHYLWRPGPGPGLASSWGSVCAEAGTSSSDCSDLRLPDTGARPASEPAGARGREGAEESRRLVTRRPPSTAAHPHTYLAPWHNVLSRCFDVVNV